MFTLQGAKLHIFGWLMLFASSDLMALPNALLTSVDSVVASKEQDHNPLYFDAVIDVNHSYTYEIPTVKTLPQTHKFAENVIATVFYQLLYYAIGQQIVVNLSTKAIIYPFHCFT